MRIRLFTLLLLGISSCLNAVVTDDHLILLIENKQSPKVLEDGLDNKEEIIAFLKEWDGVGYEVTENKYLTDKTILLANLGDSETIKRCYGEYKHGKDRTERLRGYLSMRFSHPELLRVAGDDIYSPVRERYLNTPRIDILEVPYSNAGFVLSVITQSGYFSEDVVNWFEGLEGDTGSQKIFNHLEIIRDFWTLNRDAILAGQYGRVVVPDISEDIARIRSGPPNSPVEKVVNVTAPEPATEELAEVVVTEPTEEPVEKSSNWWLWLIGLLVVVGGVIAVRRKS